MRFIKRILVVVSSLILALAATGIVTFADETDNSYSYTIVVSAGLKGTIGGGEQIEVTTGYGSRIDLSTYAGSIEAVDGYYFKGFHEAGTEKIVSNVPVTRSTTYVAAYGKKGNRDILTYTISYVDRATGNKLAEDAVGTGYAGDTALVSYKVIDQYMPEAYNERQMLIADGDNNFVFYYNYIGADTRYETRIIDGETVYVYVDNGTNVIDNTGNGGNAVPNGNDADNNATQETTGQNASAGDGINNDQESPSLPVEEIDVDNPEIPLGGGGGNGAHAGLSPFAVAGISAGAVIILGGIIALIILAVKKKKKS